MFSLLEPPLFTRLRNARRILIAGAGGGFDIYAGLPLALAPAGSETNSTGSRLAACTAEVSAAAFGWCTSIHCAPTVCIQVPMFEAICAPHRIRKIGIAMGAQAVALGGAGLTIALCSCPGLRAPVAVAVAVKRSVADGPGRIDLIRVDCGERVQDGARAA